MDTRNSYVLFQMFGLSQRAKSKINFRNEKEKEKKKSIFLKVQIIFRYEDILLEEVKAYAENCDRSVKKPQ